MVPAAIFFGPLAPGEPFCPPLLWLSFWAMPVSYKRVSKHFYYNDVHDVGCSAAHKTTDYFANLIRILTIMIITIIIMIVVVTVKILIIM